MRIVRAPLFRLLLSVALSFFVVAGSVVIHYYNRYVQIINLGLERYVSQNPAKILSASEDLVTTLADSSRSKRRFVQFNDIPKVLIDAVTAAEDQRFFSHHGLDPIRIAGALVSNLDATHPLQGGSTITQQLARNVFLRTAESTWRRKLSEAFTAVILELRLSKEQIFTMYANDVYLGQLGTFAIHGFAEGSKVQFGKELSKLTLAEAATLAAIIPAPNAYSPRKHPDRATFRRNVVLRAMVQTGAISTEDYEQARQPDLGVGLSTANTVDAPYFVDLVREELSKDYSTQELMNGGLSVYTTLDTNLQRAAVEAVENGLVSVEEQLAARRKNRRTPGSLRPQAALIALDPHTGEIKAMVGGSDYAASQYNRITRAFRQPGSAFKPIVYAAALETVYDDGFEGPGEGGFYSASQRDRVITPLTTVLDAPKVFADGGSTYAPANFNNRYHGIVTLRTALQHSLNLATIRVAERIGYNRVAALAKRLGLNNNIKGYPSIALGAFEVTLVELAGAYTAFANEGKRVEPHTLRRVVAADGTVMRTYKFDGREVLRPAVAYLITQMMMGVIDRGTGAGVRARGFTLPAAGKTGTSRDGWFVGYTKDLLVIAWVGFDDNRDLDLEGARSALPIWSEFMIKAYKLNPARDAASMSFRRPPDVNIVTVDSETLKIATPACERTFSEAFIAGTAPTAYCPLHPWNVTTQLVGWSRAARAQEIQP